MTAKSTALNPALDDSNEFEAFELNDTSSLDLELPNGEAMLFKGQQVSVELYGPSTDAFIQAKDRQNKQAMKRAVNLATGKNAKKDSQDDDREADIKFIASVTKGFKNFPYPGGVDAIYRNPKFCYIENQVRKHLGELGNFFTQSNKD